MKDNVQTQDVYLSKSLFIKGLQCHKLLFLQKNCPELKDEISDSQEAIFEGGRDVGILAGSYFPVALKYLTKGYPTRSS